jgi:hypothetical protein
VGYRGDGWYSNFKVPLGEVVARALLIEKEPRRIEVHVLATEFEPPVEVAGSIDAAKRRAGELIYERWPSARAGEWVPEQA